MPERHWYPLEEGAKWLQMQLCLAGKSTRLEMKAAPKTSAMASNKVSSKELIDSWVMFAVATHEAQKQKAGQKSEL